MRQSNYELLRLVSMFFIVLYHILAFYIVKIDDNVLYKALYLPLHVGVICFVLISGYFHINPSFKGLVKLLLPLLVFYVPLSIIDIVFYSGNIRSLLFFSRSPYWFIRIYFFLFLISPILNAFLSSKKNRIYMLCSLAFISVYMGFMQEPSLYTGKNLALFMFIYTLGDFLHFYKSKTKRISIKTLIFLYLSLNVFLVSVYSFYSETYIGILLWRLSFPYCSPILIINSVLLFLIFSKIKLESKITNWLSVSVLSIYVVHHHNIFLCYFIQPVVYGIYEVHYSPLLLILLYSCLALLIMAICVLLDRMLNLPLSNIINYRILNRTFKNQRTQV